MNEVPSNKNPSDALERPLITVRDSRKEKDKSSLHDDSKKIADNIRIYLRNDFKEKGYSPTKVSKFFEKAFKPLVKKVSLGEEADVASFQGNINRIIANFEKEQELLPEGGRISESIDRNGSEQPEHPLELKLPDNILNLLGYGNITSDEQAQALQAVSRLKNRQVLLTKQIDQLAEDGDNAEQLQKIEKSEEEIIKLFNQVHAVLVKRNDSRNVKIGSQIEEEKTPPPLILTEENRVKAVPVSVYSQSVKGHVATQASLQKLRRKKRQNSTEVKDQSKNDLKVSKNTEVENVSTGFETAYSEPNETLLKEQEEWRMAESGIEIQNTYKLLGMKVPVTGPGGVFGARSLREGLILGARHIPELDKDVELKAKYNELLKILGFVGDEGLSAEEVEKITALVAEINIPENPIHKRIEATAAARAAEVAEKLPTLNTDIKKKRGFFGKLARSMMLAAPLVAWGSPLNDNENPSSVNAMEKASVSSSEKNDITTDISPKITYTTDAEMPQPEKIAVPNTGVEFPLDTTEGIDTHTADKYQFDIVPAEMNEKGYADYNDAVDLDPKSPEYVDQIPSDVEKPVIEYTFKKGDRVNTVSEAAHEMWGKNSSVVEKSVTESMFLAAMWGVIADMEKDQSAENSLAEKMGIQKHYGVYDIGHVHTGSNHQIDLQAFYELINKKLS